MSKEIGNAAGKIWKYLKKAERATPSKIGEDTGLGRNELHRAIGWLAREEKIKFEKEGRAEYLTLT
ncbi:MAG: winged helix-turn-helix domain-containing protein [Methylococcales bacterium]